ncbi:MAG: thermonuclease family protein [Saprospiraceae bacterium]|nr:thermonuclease family protein [Saprospiraceae bacterium]
MKHMEWTFPLRTRNVRAGCRIRSLVRAVSFLILVFGLSGASCSSGSSADLVPQNVKKVWKGKVVSITDGDTFDVLNGREKTRIRLEGIDCPEKKQPFGQRARQSLSELCFRQSVRVEETGRDRNRRVIARVYLEDGRCINHEMLRQGMAWHFTRYSEDPEYAALERRARSLRTGLWADPHPVAPWDWRTRKRKAK